VFFPGSGGKVERNALSIWKCVTTLVYL